MNRYKFTEAGIQEAIQFLKGTTKSAPTWAKRFKDDLKVKGKSMEYKEMPIIPVEQVNDYLRTKMFKKDGTLPFGRDAAHHKLQQTVVGCTRRHLMRFIKANPCLNKPKRL